MITAAKFRIFEKYDGDSDGFVRAGEKSEKELIGNKDWLVIDNMIQDLQMIKKGLCSKKFEFQVLEELNVKFDIESITLIKNRIFQTMETLELIKEKVVELSKDIETPKYSIPTFGHSEQSGLPHIELLGEEYHYVICERGIEDSRKVTKDFNELLFWIFYDITFSMACELEVKNRREGEDIRIRLFQIQEDLIAKIDIYYSSKLRIEHEKILNNK